MSAAGLSVGTVEAHTAAPPEAQPPEPGPGRPLRGRRRPRHLDPARGHRGERPHLLRRQVAGALQLAVPIGLAGLGGLWAERAGVVNIGLEGMMILGTWFGAWAGYQWGPWTGVLIGIVGGALGGLLHAIITVTFNVNHIVSGVAINILAARRHPLPVELTFAEAGRLLQAVPARSTADASPCRGSRTGWRPSRDKHWFFVSDLAGVVGGLVTNLSLLTIVALAAGPRDLVGPVAHLLRPAAALLRREPGRRRVPRRQRLQVQVPRRAHLRRPRRPRRRVPRDRLHQPLPGGPDRRPRLIGLAAMIFGNWMPGGLALGAGLFGFTDASNCAAAPTHVHALLLLLAPAPGRRAAGSCRAALRGGPAGSSRRGARSLWYALTDEVPQPVRRRRARTSPRCSSSRSPRSGCGCPRRTA